MPTKIVPAPYTTLFSAVLEAAGQHGGEKVIVEDSERQQLTYNRLTLASLILGAKLAGESHPGDVVGVLLPNVNGLLVTVLGLNAWGRSAALLNFTAGARNLTAALDAARIDLVVTSRRFVETAKLEDVVAVLAAHETKDGRPVEIVYLEDVRRNIGLKDKILGLARSKLADWWHRRHARPDCPAVVLFTSGTEGLPKGVALSNVNLVSNARQVFVHASGAISEADVFLNPLPMFHSFGLTAGTLMPLLSGMRTILYPSPLQYRQIARLVRAAKPTLLLATDTFAAGYARAADQGDLASLRFIVCGAERVKETTRALYVKAGTVLLEGYGATECSPVIAVNLPDSNQPGTVGRILPGIEARLVPVEGITKGGRLEVAGPNVMMGYMLSDRPGEIVQPANGWHDTGDIVTIEDGYVSIHGRAKRFAKIGGEMVSLAAIEVMAHSHWPDSSFVCVSLPDPRKGEQLVLVTDKPDMDKDRLLGAARESGFPELWVPRHILVVATIPVLGSGKIDFQATADLVRQLRPLL